MSKPEEPATGAVSPRCPICGNERRDDYRPFCSKRCADIDLNRWLSGVYAVTAQPAGEEGDGEPDPHADVGET